MTTYAEGRAYAELKELLLIAAQLRKNRAPRQERERILHTALRGYLLGNHELTNSEDFYISQALKYERYYLAHAPRLRARSAVS